jgi:hypothetical protein
LAAAANLPHKAFLYGGLLALLASDSHKDPSFIKDLVNRLIEHLQNHLVEERNVHASKNLMRVLAIAVDYGVVQSSAFSQMLIQISEEINSGVIPKNKKNQDLDLVLDTIMAGLPISVRY